MAIKTGAKKAGLAVAQPPQVFYRINSLLYTLRTIAQREDQLCVLMHHLRTSGKLSPALSAELHEILDEIPTQEYIDDLDALRASLQQVEAKSAPGSNPRPARTRNPKGKAA